jgi:hypothetical protein
MYRKPAPPRWSRHVVLALLPVDLPLASPLKLGRLRALQQGMPMPAHSLSRSALLAAALATLIATPLAATAAVTDGPAVGAQYDTTHV